MNLQSPIFQFSDAVSGVLEVLVSVDDGTTWETAYEAHVQSPDGHYMIDLVPILSSYFTPKYESLSNQQSFLMYVVRFNSVQKVANTFFYSDNDNFQTTYVTKRFNTKYPFAITQYTPLNVIINGVTTSYDWGTFPMCRIFQVPEAVSPSLTIGSDVFEYLDSDYQIDYIDRNGNWSFFVPTGHCYRNDSVSEGSYKGYSDTQSGLYKVDGTYKKSIVPSFTINSGWLTNAQAVELSKSLLESPYVIFHSPDFASLPVKVEDTSIDFKRNTKDDVMVYQFKLVSKVPIIKY